MSDGHFNRAFLPHGDFASGVRVGRASERALCLAVFAEMIDELCPTMSEADKEAAAQKFKQTILQRER